MLYRPKKIEFGHQVSDAGLHPGMVELREVEC